MSIPPESQDDGTYELSELARRLDAASPPSTFPSLPKGTDRLKQPQKLRGKELGFRLLMGFRSSWVARQWGRRTPGQLIAWCVCVIALVVVAGPFLWAFLLHGYALYREIITTSHAGYLEKIQTLENDAFFANVRNIGLIALGVIGTLLALWRSMVAHSAHKLSEKGLIIDRYQKGAQMLESSELSVRIAGVHALRELAISDPGETYILVQDILCTYVRETSVERKPKLQMPGIRGKELEYGIFPPDLQTALTAISFLRDHAKQAENIERESDWQVNLSGANLARAKLIKANLSGANLSKANLSSARLDMANMIGSMLNRANLFEAVLTQTNLTGLQIWEANLSNTYLSGTELVDVRLKNCNLSGAYIFDANLSGAVLREIDLSRAKLWRCNLSGVNFVSVRLDARTLTTAIWAFENRRPSFLPDQMKKTIALRSAGETWANFTERMSGEQPTMMWKKASL
ncbi:pentapeptide repeat-containing protein [Roseibium aggregatum]|uniref:pentapeptide repeat-containing protein n=1 Tax=Roseibium aggregatum TaxID=187304 RepID=UPI001A8CF319|nr:pentapeptide repeat-containing protein [Roseibium aggregatum]MBN8181005.1 pentapeptide repeat-containing protein [Roseibium aggregatum]